MPHGHCYLWSTDLISLHVVSDGLIAAAYFCIPWVLSAFLRKRPDIQLPWITFAFATFILACGMTHVMEIWNIWQPDYWLAGAMKAITAAASIATAILLVRNFDGLVALPSPAQLQKLNGELELRVLERTAQLAESDKKFRFLASVIPQIMWTSKPDGNLDYYNQRWFDYTGLTFQQTKDWGWKPVLHPDDLQNCVARWTRAFSTGCNYEVEYRFKRTDGVYRWHLGRAFPHRDEQGNIIQWFGTCTDIHEQKLAAEKLEQRVTERTAELVASRARLRRITDCLPVLVAYVDREERYGFTNQTYKNWFGVEPDVFLGRSMRDVLGEDSYKVITPHIKKALNGEKVIFERDFQHKDVLKFVRGEYIPDVQEDGAVAGFYVLITDLTDRRKQEQTLLQSELRFRNTFDFAGTGMAIVGLDGKWIQVNKLLCQIVGYSEAELLKKTFQEITHPDDLETDLGFVKELLDGKRDFYQMEKRYFHRDGSIVWITLTASVVRDASNAPVYFVSQIEDIRERKQLAAKLEDALGRAVDASRLKSEFLANMSHEIRTPMNGIMGMTTLLLDTPLSADQREMMNVVQNSSESLLNIINDILDFSKIEAGKLRIEPIEFDLRQLLDETLALLVPRAHEKSLELICDFDLQLPTGMRGDGGRIRQVITNLAGNAIKFTTEGEIIVSVRQTLLTADRVGFRLEVVDSGIGIPGPVQKTLFQPFEQGDSGTTRKFGGTGLGLAISRQLIHLMVGEMGFESTAGKGSTFWFEIDLPRAAVPLSDTIAPFNSGGHVLVVDDNATNRRVLTAHLAKLGFTSESAGNATDALVLLARAGSFPVFTLAILDWHMPGIDGVHLAREIRQNRRYLALPIVMLSSSAADAREAKALNALVLTKPAREAPFRRTISHALSGARTAQTASNFIPLSLQTCHILLADDNATNQLVGRMLLEKMGHTVTVVEDGLEVIEALKGNSFDVVFMDCQMPHLDGYEATRRIRDGAAGEASSKVPIIALTAYAMSSDRIKCLEAGMNDYMSKPLRVEDVSSVILRTLVEQKEAAPLSPWDGSEAPFDLHVLTLFDGMISDGQPVVRKLIEIFERDEPKRLAVMKIALRERSAKKLSLEAHSMAGTCGTLGGREVRARAHAIEQAAIREDWDPLSSKISGLEDALTRFHAELRRFVS